MGCISSKAIARSISIREKPNPGTQGGASVTWEELLASHSGNDKLFSLVCSANSIATKLRSSSFTLPSGDPGTAQDTKFLASAWELIPEINGNAGIEPAPDDVGEPNFGRFTRSRSCQALRDKDELGLDPGIENKIDWRDRNLAGSRSFHTVEEYDALLERIHRFSTRDVQEFGDLESWSDVKVPQSISLVEGQKELPGSDECNNLDQEGLKNGKNFEKDVEVDGAGETGWKRKSIAKGLKSLDVSGIEFPGIARFRQRYHHVEGHIYSPGTYVTPKFGSYNAKAMPAAKENKGEEDSVFSPELVAAFEDCMQQLQEEEDSILNHIEEYSQADDVTENQVDKSSIKHK